MPKIIEEKLRERIAEGKCTADALRRALAAERNSISIVTMPTLGAMGHDLNRSEGSARTQLNQDEQEAAHNVPILERALAALGESTETFVCKSCGKHRPTRQCSMCHEPSEY